MSVILFGNTYLNETFMNFGYRETIGFTTPSDFPSIHTKLRLDRLNATNEENVLQTDYF